MGEGRTGFCKSIFASLWRRSVATEEGGENVWGLARLLPSPLLPGMHYCTQARDQAATYCSVLYSEGQALAWLRLARHWGAAKSALLSAAHTLHCTLHTACKLLCPLCPLCTLHCALPLCTLCAVCSVQRPECRVHYAVSSQESWARWVWLRPRLVDRPDWPESSQPLSSFSSKP